jgi:penicillin G amidase
MIPNHSAPVLAPVEVITDRFGVPHIRASSAHDAFVAQGFVAARDRLWQIDLWRRRGLGLLSEVLGEHFVEHDRAARLFLYRGDLDEEWAHYGDDTEAICRSFTAGINAFIDLLDDRPELLPLEFGALDYAPSRWDASDIVRIRNHGMFYNAADEIARAITLRDFGPRAEAARQPREPLLEAVVPDGVDLDRISAEVLRLYNLAVLPPDYSDPGQPSPQPVRMEGSNNWVVAGSRTVTGRPILANDPHRDTTRLPGLRYITHIKCPEFDVIGAGEPHLPGISIGHNGTIAFGLTVFTVDQEDVYLYDLDPADPTRYRYGDGWETFKTIHETIPLREGAGRGVDLTFTRHGPLLHVDEQQGFAVGIRTAMTETGTAPYLASLGAMRATTWEEFRHGMRGWGSPGENQVFADTSGNIGLQSAAKLPRRNGWDGTLPVPGDGRHEWDGFHPLESFPRSFNPSGGWIATANEYHMDPDSVLALKAGFMWAPPDRSARIQEVLRCDEPVSVESMFALQTDTLNGQTLTVLRQLREYVPSEPDPLLARLLAWDGEYGRDSWGAPVYEVWFRQHLRPVLVSLMFDPPHTGDVELARRLTAGAPRPTTDDRPVVDFLRDPRRYGVEAGALTEAIASTFAAAREELRSRLGDDPTRWSWDRLHRAESTHPFRRLLAGRVPDELLTTGPLPKAGGPQSVNMSSFGSDFRQVFGATFRLVVDVGDWDNSVAVNAPGQSGDLRSSHYQDLAHSWAEEKGFPLLYSRERVEAEQESTLLLVPRRA